VDIIMPDGAAIHYDRISKGTGYADAVYEHTDTATAFLRSEFRWNGVGWDLRFTDGSVMTFPENYGGTQPHHGAPTEMRDGTGHKIQFARDSDRNLDKLTSPAGHSISFEHDARSRVVMAATDTAQAVRYAYDAGGRLRAVTAGDRVTRFGYDDLNLTSVDVSGKRVLAVAYKDDRVASLTAADGRTYTFNYLTLGTDANRVTETIVYAPDDSRTRIRLPRDRN
jgi:YD repeat-containing protein